MKLEDRIFEIKSDAEFSEVALDVYEYQLQNCAVYRDFVNHLNYPKPNKVVEIPFLPIEFFKTHPVYDTSKKPVLEFKSSGTGGNRSSHFVVDPTIYTKSFNLTFRSLIGNPEEMVVLALLPNYIEQGESSLVYMVDQLIKQAHPLSGFCLHDHQSLFKSYQNAIELNKKVVIFGVSYALLDLCEMNNSFEKAIIIETGGMKGRREELSKNQLHERLTSGLNCANIYSEYGMTELLSQAYSKEDLIFQSSPWMKVLIRDMNDPLTYCEEGKTGGINVIDLANLHSCSFIATQDLGKIKPGGFELLGRFDQSDIRGCNLLVQ